MHPLIAQRREALDAMLIRSQAARGEFTRLTNKAQPEKRVRFQVVSKGAAWHIVEQLTGKVRGFRWNYQVAIDFAQDLEEKANRPSGGGK